MAKSVRVSIFDPKGDRCVGPIRVSEYRVDWNARELTYTVDERERLDHGARIRWTLGEGWSVSIIED
jgi:hypothetical protein